MNKIDNIENLLTNSAKQKIEEIMADNKAKLLERAFNIASQHQTEKVEISLRDVLEASDNDKSVFIRQKNNLTKRKNMTYLIALTGGIYAIIGFIIYFYQNFNFDLKNDLGLIMAILGVFLTFTAFFFNQINDRIKIGINTNLKGKNVEYLTSLDYAIVDRWEIIEKLTKNYFEKNEPDKKMVSFTQLLNYLAETLGNSNESSKDIKRLLKARNLVVHESYSFSDSERKELLSIADNMIEKLEKK